MKINIVLLIAFLAGCTLLPKKVTTESINGINYINQTKLLYSAYLTQSNAKLESFFENWYEQSSQVTDVEYKKSSLKEDVQKIIDVFYNPSNLHGSEWGNELYKNSKYYLFDSSNIIICETDSLTDYSQTKIDSIVNYEIMKRAERMTPAIEKELFNEDGSFTDWAYNRFSPEPKYNDESTTIIDTVNDIFPKIKINNAKILNLNNEYKKIISSFLKNEICTPNNLMSPNESYGESKTKEHFLEQFVTIFPSHWGESWNLATAPNIGRIVFNKDRSVALLYFGIVYEGGVAVLKKENDEWFVKNALLTWIE